MEIENRRDAAIDWILNAQKATDDGGVSAYYDINSGYAKTSYPEVTGYIIPTMFDIYKLTDDRKYFKAAIEMTDWITEVQLKDGSVTSMDFQTPYVFDTGQDISGWVRAYKENGNEEYKKAAEKAGSWLVDIQREDGSFPLTPYNNSTHTYHARVSWMLLQLYKLTGNEKFKNTATKNLDWALTVQKENRWSVPTEVEITHFIAYAGRGLLECGSILEEKRYLDAARVLAEKLLELQLEDGSLWGHYNIQWEPTDESSCLTGNLQIAIIWLRLWKITNEEKYLKAAKKAIEYVSNIQDISSPNLGIKGGVAGSFPIDGSYSPNKYLAWAAKFYIDAVNLLLNPELELTS